jgi:HD-GYP domain-containing protein (c-di-GMP phosphodiesterase class II)
MKEFPIIEIKEGYFFSQPAYLDDGFVLLPPEVAFNSDVNDILKTWGFTKILSDGEPQEHYAGKTMEKKAVVYTYNDAAKISEAHEYISDLNEFIIRLFNRAKNSNPINYSIVASKVRELCEKIKEDRRYILQVESENTGEGEDSQVENFNAAHCIKSAIIAVIMGMYLKLPAHRLIEVGIAALVHEIGMVRTPPKILLSKDRLSEKELEVLRMHPTHGFEILKNNDFPMIISTTAFEHHERENGSGYPRKLSGSTISFYSKIIAVACSYAAITAKRPHQDARGGYEGVTDLLRNEGKQYDDAIIRALVFSLSLYPIGQFVLLSNGMKGQVVDVNPDNPRFPVVQVFSEQTPDGKNKIIETSRDGILVAKPLDKNDMQAV